MNEYELQEIWKKNLREFIDVMKLDSIIIYAMQEAIKEAQYRQCNIAYVSGMCEHPFASVIGDGEMKPAKCLKCGKYL